MVILSNFSETLKELLFDNGLDGKSFGQKIGVEGTTITRYIKGDRLPTIKSLTLIADYFNCSTDYLLGLENEIYTKSFKPCPPFSEQLEKILKNFGYTYFRLSREAKIDQSTIYSWKAGKRAPTLDNVVKLANLFDCSIDFIIGRI